ncbi:MAG TPA: FAD-dependent oxidoreductase, partial [Gaiellaceae bacterium]|nr:FAD-dependent oxidoreductase [Gaiellaceae bacterium]
APVRSAVVGGGVAGLAAALELADGGHEVTLYEARPTLGGKVQTLPRREGDPEPPPDNGQHIALGCFTEYLRFLERIESAGFDVFDGPPQLSALTKLRIVGEGLRR